MKQGFKKAGRIFLYLFILYTIAYWIFIIIDDWGFIEKYWDEHWLDYLMGWSVWYLVFLVGLSFYYWLIATTIIIIYYKLIKRKQTE
jgi:hypothetical protein